MLFWYFRTALLMAARNAPFPHRSDISSLEVRRRRLPRQRLRSSRDVFTDSTFFGRYTPLHPNENRVRPSQRQPLSQCLEWGLTEDWGDIDKHQAAARRTLRVGWKNSTFVIRACPRTR
jgi:hypothetical protein